MRRLLTDILLTVTNSEISAVVKEAMEEEETSKEWCNITSSHVIIDGRIQIQDSCITKESSGEDQHPR